MTEDTKDLASKYRIQTPKQLDQKGAIVIVEDQQDLRLIIVHHLKKMGYPNISQCRNGYEAIELMRDGINPAAMICDMEMPVMGGLDLLAEMREDTRVTRGPFAIAMDNPSKEKLMLAVENGVDEILVKPFTMNDIIPKIRDSFRKFHFPGNPEKVYELAKQTMRDNKPDLSAMIYSDLAAAAPKAARPIVGLARIANMQGDQEKALKLLADAEERNPNFVHLYAERAQVYAKKKDWNNAISAFKKAIELSPLNAIRYKDAADALFKVKRYQEAVDILNLALRNELSFPDLYHYLSQASFALKDYETAAKHVRSALSSDPENVTYLNQLGICQKELNQFDGARQTYNQIIKIDPGNAAALYNKAVLLHARGDKGEAVRILKRLTAKKPDFEPAVRKLKEYEAA